MLTDKMKLRIGLGGMRCPEDLWGSAQAGALVFQPTQMGPASMFLMLYKMPFLMF